MAGFDADFVERLREIYTCPICYLALKEPRLTVCGHLFCDECVSPLKRAAADPEGIGEDDGTLLACPVCRTRLNESQIFPDNRVKREVLNLSIKCEQRDSGCDWTGELSQREKHNDRCVFVLKLCSEGCGVYVMRKNCTYHEQKICPKRTVDCQYCTEKMRFEELNDHLEVCDNYPVPCTFKCGSTIEQGKMAEHVSRHGTCAKSPLCCDFDEAGCHFEGNRLELENHLQLNMAGHLSMLMSCHKRDKAELCSVKTELQKLRSFVASSASCHLHQHDSVEQFVYVWKIEKWSEKLQDAKAGRQTVLFSLLFYIGQPGYQMKLRADPNGLPGGAGSHLSLALVPMKGNYDDKVKWPFPYSFSITVVDQQLVGNDVTRTFHPPYGRDFDGPESRGRCDNRSWSHSKLLDVPNSLVNDDILIVRLSVDLSSVYSCSL